MSRYFSSYDIVKAYQEIRKASSECQDPELENHLAWGIKQDLYLLKWFLDDTLKDCPHFSEYEEHWLKVQEKKKIIRILKND